MAPWNKYVAHPSLHPCAQLQWLKASITELYLSLRSHTQKCGVHNSVFYRVHTALQPVEQWAGDRQWKTHRGTSWHKVAVRKRGQRVCNKVGKQNEEWQRKRRWSELKCSSRRAWDWERYMESSSACQSPAGRGPDKRYSLHSDRKRTVPSAWKACIFSTFVGHFKKTMKSLHAVELVI